MNRNNGLSKYNIKIKKCFCVDIGVTQTAEILGFNRKTVNRYFVMFCQIIEKFQNEEKDKIIGVVELHESYFSRTRIKGTVGIKLKGRSTHKQSVFSVFERNGRVCTEIVSDVSKATLTKIIQEKVKCWKYYQY